MNTKKTEPRSAISIPMLIGTLIILSVVMSTIFVVSTFNKSQNTQRIAVVDITVLTQQLTLDLAKSDLSDDEIRKQAGFRANEIEAHLKQLAEQYNLVILPSEIGTWGAQNITSLVLDRLKKTEAKP